MSRVVIVGFGGIGAALVKQHLDQGDNLVLVSRKPVKQKGIINIPMDNLTSAFTDSPPDRVIVATGILHTENHMPEKKTAQFTQSWFNENLSANLMPTVETVQAIMQTVPRAHPFKLICLSARVSSITDNRLGGWHSYRMSKAALNMFIKNVSIEWRLKYPNSGIFGYHPGTVDTRLSIPFQENVPTEKLFTADHAAELLIKQADKLTTQQSGFLIDWKGEKIPY